MYAKAAALTFLSLPMAARRGTFEFHNLVRSPSRFLPGAATPLRELTGMMVTARVADLGRAQRAPLEMRAAGEKIASFEPFFKGGKQNFEDYFPQPWPATSAFCSQCWS